MYLNFSNDIYKNLALTTKTNKETDLSYLDAFMLLINGIDYENLSNLCSEIQKNIDVPLEECYKLTQNLTVNEEIKIIIYTSAINCLNNNIYLGNKTINDGKINTSSWLSHSLNVGIVCKNLAKTLNLNENTAQTLGLLHDYGRKYEHSFNHAIRGYEELTRIGLSNEGLACLTHSFVKGGRCSNNEPALEGFYIDNNGNPQWKENTKIDDITIFLNNYKYSNYDLLLNIADLMATDKQILSPCERIKDIATRRTIDPTNRSYFLSEITNLLIDFIKITYPNTTLNYIKPTINVSQAEIEKYFEYISEIFFKNYQKTLNKKDSIIL